MFVLTKYHIFLCTGISLKEKSGRGIAALVASSFIFV
jgi:hypothetical protein